MLKQILIISILILSSLVVNSNKLTKRKEVFLKEITVISHKIIPDSIIQHIKDYEQFRAKSYYLGKAHYIGYGHLIRSNETFDSITEQQATNILIQDFLEIYNIINKETKLLFLKKNEKIALTMLAYNVGYYKIKKWRLWDSIVNKRDCSIWLNYCYFNQKKHLGLYKRRLFEYKLFIKN